MPIQWRNAKTGKPVSFANAHDFVTASDEIPQNIRTTYDNYTQNKKPSTLEKKGDYYQTDWMEDDANSGFSYKATYDDQWGWGVMRVPYQEKKQAPATGQTTIVGQDSGAPGSMAEMEWKIMNTRFKDMQGLLEEIRDYLKTLAGIAVDSGFTTADKAKQGIQET